MDLETKRNDLVGTVQWFNEKKGYGFIKSDSGDDYFAHYSDIQKDGFKTLNQGDKVSFDAELFTKGWAAKNIVVTEESSNG